MILRLVVVVSFFMIVAACSKSNSGPSSAEGNWTYTTPDGKIKVNFELVKTSSGSLDVQNQSIRIDGTVYMAEKEITGVSLPDIAKIRINANDAKITYPYYVQLLNGKVSGDFKRIDVPTGSYTFPYPTVVALANISVVRP